ncbi:MAG: sulfatase [Pirellulales bacterium]
MDRISCLYFWRMSLCLLVLGMITSTCFALETPAEKSGHPNVLLILCDDLNDYVDGFGGYRKAVTPNMVRLAASGVRFTQAHCNIPICGPSRACLFSGIYPHNSGCYGFTKWDTYDVLKNSRTLMDYFRLNNYYTLGTGKLLHHMVRGEWKSFGNRADYGPFAYDGKNNLPHPDTPAPYCEIGAVDGSFGPLVSLDGKTSSNGQPLMWRTGGWQSVDELKIYSAEKHDPTPDEKNGEWAINKLQELAATTAKNRIPFFMGVGFIRPHTPLIVPQRFFDMFPIDDIDLPEILDGDIDDTFAHTIRGLPTGKEPDSSRTEDMGHKLFHTLVKSYGSRDEALRYFIQAYLASIASVDEQIGRILDVIDGTELKTNTIIILTSDHGWGMGEKDYLYKNSLWQESTRIPLIVRAPDVAVTGTTCNQPVSLVDIYPTLIDLCDLQGDTMKNEKGHPLDGHSFRSLLKDPTHGTWDGPDEALTALYKWRMKYDPQKESYALRGKGWRYIRYENGKEELYDCVNDPHEWNNLATHSHYHATLNDFREKLRSRIPSPDSAMPPQPPFRPANSTKNNTVQKLSAEEWKNQYFEKHPGADTNNDGTLTWPEYKAFRMKFDPEPKK